MSVKTEKDPPDKKHEATPVNSSKAEPPKDGIRKEADRKHLIAFEVATFEVTSCHAKVIHFDYKAAKTEKEDWGHEVKSVNGTKSEPDNKPNPTDTDNQPRIDPKQKRHDQKRTPIRGITLAFALKPR